MATWIPMAVAAIDFGTMFSGWAMSFKCEPTRIITNTWSNGNTGMSTKTPTNVLIKPDGSTLEAFGYDAETKYMLLGSDRKDYYFFKKFKMMLYHNSAILTKDVQLQAENGKSLPALLVFSLAIRFLRDDVIADCNKRVATAINASDIHWTLTVPAIWNDQAKKFMREAAKMAGIDGDKMTIVLEPEAASCFCRHAPAEKSTDGTIVSFEPGSKYILIDCGGGTTDICCHEVLEDRRLKEIHKASGNAIGGSNVDLAFEAFIAKLFGSKRICKFKEKSGEDYLDFFRTFEIKKQSYKPDKGDNVTIKVPSDLIESKKIEKKVKKAGYKGKIKVSSDKIRISHACFREEIFDDVMGRFRKTLKDVCSSRKVSDVKTVILVGGFSESEVLQESVKDELSDKTIICVPEAGLAVLRGAVLYGHDDTIIQARIARFTYGLNHYLALDTERHLEEKAIKRQGRCSYVEKLLPILEAGEEIPADLEKDGFILEPFEEGLPSISCNLYAIDEIEEVPEYVDDPRCHKLGKISAPITDRSVPLDQQVFRFKFKFGGTEITATCLEMRTKKTVQASINFLG